MFSLSALLATAPLLVLIVLSYGDLRNQTELLYALPRWAHGLATVLILPVFPLLLAAYLPGAIRNATKHPMLVAVKLWALAHLLANGFLADVVLFGSFLVWAVADRISLKRRTPRATPALPESPWNDVIVVVGGLILYGAMLNFGHRLLIGVPLM